MFSKKQVRTWHFIFLAIKTKLNLNTTSAYAESIDLFLQAIKIKYSSRDTVPLIGRIVMLDNRNTEQVCSSKHIQYVLRKNTQYMLSYMMLMPTPSLSRIIKTINCSHCLDLINWAQFFPLPFKSKTGTTGPPNDGSSYSTVTLNVCSLF